jgi:signal transduction histidine kinase
MNSPRNLRILLVDDNPAIHEDFKKTLLSGAAQSPAFRDVESALFDEREPSAPAGESYQLDSAHQGQEALEKVRAAKQAGTPYALAFVDVRMPPGWNGIETLEQVWRVDEQLQAVLCTAYSDYSWEEMIARLGRSDRLLILKKPFDAIEVRQLACALIEKWNVSLRERLQLQEVRRAEQEARAYAASLETVNRALDTSRRAAEAEAQLKTDLIRRMAHSVSSPVSDLLDGLEGLRSPGVAKGDWLSRAGELCRDGGRLRGTLQDLADFADLQNGSLQPELSRWSPRSLVSELVEDLRRTAAQGQPALELTLQEGTPAELLGDAPRVRRILRHVLGNALENTTRGPIRVLVGAEEAPGLARPHLRVEVVDSGPGLSPEAQGALFEHFCHVDESPAARAGHLGLGLSVSRSLARLLGGDLQVESTPGKGSRFVLTVKSSAVGARP